MGGWSRVSPYLALSCIISPYLALSCIILPYFALSCAKSPHLALFSGVLRASRGLAIRRQGAEMKRRMKRRVGTPALPGEEGLLEARSTDEYKLRIMFAACQDPRREKSATRCRGSGSEDRE